MGAEISIILDTRRSKKDEVFPIKLRVYFQAKTVLYPTVFDLTKSDYAKLSAKNLKGELSLLRDKLEVLKKEAIKAADDIIPFYFQEFYKRFIYSHSGFINRKKKIDELLPVAGQERLKKEWVKHFPILQMNHPAPDCLSATYSKIIHSLLIQKRIGSAYIYNNSYQSIFKYAGNVHFSKINVDFLFAYENWMLQKKKTISTVGIMTRHLRAAFNDAIREKLIKQEIYPFGRGKYIIPMGRNVKKALNRQQLQEFHETQADKSERKKAKAFWFFSYYGNGMNIKDIVHLKFSNIENDMLIFERAKTALSARGRDPIKIRAVLNEEMWKIIQEYGNKDRDPDNYIFPILHSGMSPIEQHHAKVNFIRMINLNLKKLTQEKSLSVRPNTSKARHSMSTQMKNAGAPIAYVKEILGHANVKTTENYFGDFEVEQSREFAKHLEMFKNVSPVDQKHPR